MDAKTVLKELNEVVDKAFVLIDEGKNDTIDKPNLELYRLVDALDKLRFRIEKNGGSLQFAFHNIRSLICKGKPSQESLYLNPYPYLMYMYTWENYTSRIDTLLKAERLLLGCIHQDEEDQSLRKLLTEFLEAKQAYAGYFVRTTYPKHLSNSELEYALKFLSSCNTPHDEFLSMHAERNFKKEDCQDENV